MEQFINFVFKYWMMWALFAILVVAIVYTELKGKIFGIQLISPQELTEYLNHEKGVVIDVRDAKDYQEGHILGAIHIPEDQISEKMATLEKYRDRPVILVCADGYHSPNIGATLQKQQFERVFALQGGIQVWKSENLPLEE